MGSTLVLLSQSYSSNKNISLKEVREMYQKIKNTNQISAKVIDYLAYEIITRDYDLMFVFFDGDLNNLRSIFSNTLNVITIDIKGFRAASTASALFHEMTHAAIERAFYYDTTPNPTYTKVINELKSSPNCGQTFNTENEEDSLTLLQRQLRSFGECSNNDLLSHYTGFQEKLENALLKPLEKANKLLGPVELELPINTKNLMSKLNEKTWLTLFDLDTFLRENKLLSKKLKNSDYIEPIIQIIENLVAKSKRDLNETLPVGSSIDMKAKYLVNKVLPKIIKRYDLRSEEVYFLKRISDLLDYPTIVINPINAELIARCNEFQIETDQFSKMPDYLLETCSDMNKIWEDDIFPHMPSIEFSQEIGKLEL